MKGVRISMLYQYFDVKSRFLSSEIASLERKTGSNLSLDDLHRLSYLRIKKEVYDQVFRDLCQLTVDFLQFK